MKFKIHYTNGFQVIEAKDIFAAAKWAQHQYKNFFNRPVKIEQLEDEAR